ncbi:MAG: VOC family protein [Nitrospinaceae bacterium]|nr:VOC family protein [Nitrospinaceae bacterium]NIR55377.1 VOC family protein [Nitrospinaceae bacterium]NIS85814.1 VOC family protein [Nitrospinaceae bacterium]NIT82663.1 VOC family protein [Nitrospinaceae bacterium]NIU44871.1 VOC family protein [Nitrospinaceae bacterium]
MKVKKYLHTRFRVSDMDRSLKFYRDLLGLEISEQSTSPRGSKLVYLKLPGGDNDLELCSFPTSGQVEVPEDLAHLAFEVDNLEDWVNRLEKAGVPVTEGPVTTSRGNRFIFTEDPDKYEIELIEPARHR